MTNEEHHSSRMRVFLAMAHRLRLTGPYHLNGDRVMSSQSHPLATMSEAFHRQVATPSGATESDDATLFAVAYDLLQAYLELRRLAAEYMEAERTYRLEHDRQQAGIGITVKANQAENALRQCLGLPAATMSSEPPC